jgi:hypothetical protein
MIGIRVFLAIGLTMFACRIPSWSAVYGRIAGVVMDPSGSIILGAKLILTNTAQGVQYKASTDSRGAYSFPSVPVGRYDLAVEATGFRPQNRTGLAVDLNSALQVDVTLELAGRRETITVTEASPVFVDVAGTQLGEVMTGRSMTAAALNGRSFTDMLALQPGIVPVTTQQPDSIVMAGVTVAIAPSGSLNPGTQSIGGQREDANGFLVNGGDVKELMNGCTSIVPNLDSIAEFGILTNNFDPEYGNSSSGVVNVITKTGSNAPHGGAFEFLRNTSLDARNFFSPTRSFYRQNQFGGMIGGPMVKNRIFFFGDYQRGSGRASIPGCFQSPHWRNDAATSPAGQTHSRELWADRISPGCSRKGWGTRSQPTNPITLQVAPPPAPASFPTPPSHSVPGRSRPSACSNTFRFPISAATHFQPRPKAKSFETTKRASAPMETANAGECSRPTTILTTTT